MTRSPTHTKVGRTFPDSVTQLKGCVEELSNFTYFVFAGIALCRLCVFRSIYKIFILCLEERKLHVNLSKSKYIILLSYYSYAFEQCFGSIN